MTAKLLSIAVLAATLFCAVPLASRAQTPPAYEIEGWQNAKFGMSKADVRNVYPAARISDAMCVSPAEVRPGRDCVEVELEEVQAAGLAWRARFSFTKNDQLSEIYLDVKSPADVQTRCGKPQQSIRICKCDHDAVKADRL
jgi:hypothetical protein